MDWDPGLNTKELNTSIPLPGWKYPFRWSQVLDHCNKKDNQNTTADKFWEPTLYRSSVSPASLQLLKPSQPLHGPLASLVHPCPGDPFQSPLIFQSTDRSLPLRLFPVSLSLICELTGQGPFLLCTLCPRPIGWKMDNPAFWSSPWLFHHFISLVNLAISNQRAFAYIQIAVYSFTLG